jgi:hypothetical protein
VASQPLASARARDHAEVVPPSAKADIIASLRGSTIEGLLRQRQAIDDLATASDDGGRASLR